MKTKFVAALVACAGAAAGAFAQCPSAPVIDADLGTLTPSSPLSTTVLVTAAEVHWFKFTTTAPVDMSALTYIDITNSGSTPGGAGTSVDSELGLFACDGTLIATDDDDAEGLVPALSFGSGSAAQIGSGGVWSNGRDGRLPAGEYYLSVSLFNSTFADGFSVSSASTNANGVNCTLGLTMGTATALSDPAGTVDLGTMGMTDVRTRDDDALNAGEVRWYKVVVPESSLESNRFLDIDTENSLLAATNATRIAVYNTTGVITGTLNATTRLSATTALTDATDGTNSLSQVSLGVGLRPAPGNGVAYNGRDGNLQAGTYLVGIAGPGTAPSAIAASGSNFGFVSTSTNAGTIDLRIATGTGEIPLQGAGSAQPTSVDNCGSASSLLRVTATPANTPPGPSTGIAVSADISAIGGSATQAFYDDGSNGDVAAGDNIFSYLHTVPSTVSPAAYSMPFTVSDAEGRSSNGTVSLTVTLCPPPGDLCTNPIPAILGDNPFTTTGLGSNATLTCGGSGEDIFFSFTPANSQDYFIGVCGATFDTVIGVRSDCATQIVCDDDGCGDGLTSRVLTFLSAGTPYIIQVDGFGGADGSGTLVISDQVPMSVTGTNVTGQELSTVLMQATVSPAGPNPSTGITVTGDLTNLGGLATQAFFDDGTNGDLLAGDNVFSYAYTLSASNITGAYTVALSASDAQARTASGTLTVNVTNGPSGACCASDSTCTFTRQTLCAQVSGVFQGAGTNCGGQGYVMSAGTGVFEDISATGTVLATVSTCDDCVESVSLPFTFTHMGNGYSSVTVSSNGNLQFSGASTAFGNVDIPNTAVPNDMLAPAWDDYDTDEASAGQGTVYFLDDSAANNRVIISWQDCSQYDLPGLDANSFQVILYGNGNAEFRYGAMNNILNPSIAGDTVTIGYESFDGSFGGQYDSLTVGGGNTSVVLTGGVVPGPCSAACDTIDFNGDSLFPDVQDISDFIFVFGGGACPTGTLCGDIDFNNDGLFPDTLDISALISVFGGGDCLR